jgi:predicted SprT family Zn-dependent metalloprotease
MSKTIIRCQCGTVYERETHKLQYRDHDTYECRICKRELDRWNGSVVPEFKLT